MIKKSLLLGCLLSLTFTLASAGNSISGSRGTIDTPLSDADALKITESKYWPQAFHLKLEKANDDAFASLEKIPELQNLHISRDSEITSLAPLAHLPQLRSLNIRSLKAAKENPIDASPVANCKDLEELTFYATPVTGLDALSACKQLKMVNLYMANAESLEFLRSTPLVTELDLYGRHQRFPSYEPVATLSRLTKLSIYMNPQATDENMACLKALTQLEEINIGSCREITNLEFLRNCTEMERLQASGCRKLIDIEALANMHYLDEVNLSSCPIRDITSLHNKRYLKKLNLSEAQITDLSPLAESIYMQRLELDEVKFSDLRPLGGMQLLEYLDLTKSHADISTLPRLRKLEGLRLNGTAVSDLSPLERAPRLQYIFLSDTPVTDLNPLAELPNLKTVHVAKSFPPEQIDAFQSKRPDVDIK